MGQRRSTADYAADAFEAFMGATFIGTFARWDGMDNAVDPVDYFEQYLGIGAINIGVKFTASILSLTSLLLAASAGHDDAATRDTFKRSFREDLRNIAKISEGDPSQSMLGLLLAASSSNSNSHLAKKLKRIPGLGNLNSRSIATITANLKAVGILLAGESGLKQLDKYLINKGLSDKPLLDRYNDSMDLIADTVVDSVFDTVKRAKNDIFRR